MSAVVQSPAARAVAAAHLHASFPGWQGAIILVGCSGLITIDVITAFFKRGMVESFEMSALCSGCLHRAWLFGFATTSKTYIRVDILLDAVFRGPSAWRSTSSRAFSLALDCGRARLVLLGHARPVDGA